jgi:hypothetical protein
MATSDETRHYLPQQTMHLGLIHILPTLDIPLGSSRGRRIGSLVISYRRLLICMERNLCNSCDQDERFRHRPRHLPSIICSAAAERCKATDAVFSLQKSRVNSRRIEAAIDQASSPQPLDAALKKAHIVDDFMVRRLEIDAEQCDSRREDAL